MRLARAWIDQKPEEKQADWCAETSEDQGEVLREVGRKSLKAGGRDRKKEKGR